MEIQQISSIVIVIEYRNCSLKNNDFLPTKLFADAFLYFEHRVLCGGHNLLLFLYINKYMFSSSNNRN